MSTTPSNPVQSCQPKKVSAPGEVLELFKGGYLSIAETIAALDDLIPTPAQGPDEPYVHIDNVVYHLDDVEVDKAGKCSWTDVANALTHIKLCIERRTSPLPSTNCGTPESKEGN